MTRGFAGLATALVLFGLASEAHAECVRPTKSRTAWLVARSPRLPGVTLLLPPTLRRDIAEDTIAFHPQPHGSRWADSMWTQVSVFQDDSSSSLFSKLPVPAPGRAEFSRCEAFIDGGHLTVVVYNKREEVGDMAFIGPFQVFAEYRTRSGVVIKFYGSSESREGFEQLQAAAYTIRVRPPLRPAPNESLQLSGDSRKRAARALIGFVRS